MPVYDTKTGVTLLDSQVPFIRGVYPPELERLYMNPIRFRTNYRILPCYLGFCAVCLALVVVLGSIDDEKYMAAMIGLFAAMAAVTVPVLMAVPKTRKKELELEEARYDFDTSSVAVSDHYEIGHEGMKLRFSADGLKIDDGKFFWYSALKPRLVTSNRFNRIWLAVEFGTDPLTDLFVPLSPALIRAAQTLPIPLENRKALDYLLTHKSNAFAQIYNSGTFDVFED